jgi:peptidoglycan hydrolase-like protein with peptidoglycan-binding domain
MATAAGVRSIARNEVGYRESGTNHQKYSPAVPGLEWSQNQPWCSTFISWLFHQANASDIAPVTASCLAGVAWFKNRGQWHTSAPKVGDIVYYGPNGGEHVELVVAVGASTMTTVGGNTSGSLNGTYFNGDGVYEKDVPLNASRIYGFGRPDYDGASTSPSSTAAKASGKAPTYPGVLLRRGSVGSAVRVFQDRMKARGWHLDVDGIYGPDTETIVEQFQSEKHLTVDGVVGRETWTAAWNAPVTP